MLSWTKTNDIQLKKLEQIIIDSNYIKLSNNDRVYNEVSEILQNKTLDLNNRMEEIEVPLVILACIWKSKTVLKLLLQSGADVNISYNPFITYGDVVTTEYCKDEAVNSLDILLKEQQELIEFSSDSNCLIEARDSFKKHLVEIDDCITILKGFGGIPSLN